MSSRRPGAALNSLALSYPNFKRVLAEYIHKQIQKEAENTCDKLKEVGPSSFTRQDVKDFSIAELYQKLTRESPIMMSALLGAASKEKYASLQVISVMCSVQCAVCSVQCAVCSVQCAVCGVQCAV